MKAITREEKIISGENLTPITRKELFLAKAAGQDVETPMPITREEMFLDKIQGGGGGGSALPSQHKTIDITENGTVEVTPDYGYTLSKVTANVNVDGNLEVFVATSDVELFIVNEQGIFTLDEYMANQGGISKALIQLVDTLPEKLIVSSMSNSGGIFYIYVIESTGIAYLNLGDELNNISVTAGQVLFTEAGSDKGWIDNIDSATEYGVYCVRKSSVDKIQRYIELNGNSMKYILYDFKGTSVDELMDGVDTSDVTDMSYLFYNCVNLTHLPLFDTRNANTLTYSFGNCTNLTSVPQFDVRNATTLRSIAGSCPNITGIWLRNIKAKIQVGSGTSWGHLITLESLLHLCKECRKTTSSLNLTVGTANLEKLENVYVKLIDITDDMRAEDDLIDEKSPFVVCESTDDGAMTIQDYMALKMWSLA